MGRVGRHRMILCPPPCPSRVRRLRYHCLSERFLCCLSRPTPNASPLSPLGVNIDVVQETGDTPISLAAFFGRQSVVSELVRRGADVGCRDHEGLAPGEAFDVTVDLGVQQQIQVHFTLNA